MALQTYLNHLTPRFKKIVEGEPALLKGSLAYEAASRTAVNSQGASQSDVSIHIETELWRGTVIAAVVDFVALFLSIVILVKPSFEPALGIAVVVIAALVLPVLLAVLFDSHLSRVHGLELGGRVPGFLALLAPRAMLAPDFEQKITGNRWSHGVEIGVVRCLLRTIMLSGLAIGIVYLVFWLIGLSLNHLSEITSDWPLFTFAFSIAIALGLFAVPLISIEGILKYRTNNLEVSVNTSVRVLFSGTNKLRVLSGSLNHEFWTHPRTLGALRALRERNADVIIWTVNPRMLPEDGQQLFNEKIKPAFRNAQVTDLVRFLDRIPPLQHFMLADGGRCRIEDWHLPPWERVERSYNNVYLFNPFLAWELESIVAGLERQPQEGIGE